MMAGRKDGENKMTAFEKLCMSFDREERMFYRDFELNVSGLDMSHLGYCLGITEALYEIAEPADYPHLEARQERLINMQQKYLNRKG